MEDTNSLEMKEDSKNQANKSNLSANRNPNATSFGASSEAVKISLFANKEQSSTSVSGGRKQVLKKVSDNRLGSSFIVDVPN